ncbi:prosaposin-like [Rhynchophorus ferrugineus]|uniref:prosaposin-like n=1 Tax=Rhynchophorus ferrugineus TaxID=354439 RepID=UPI003FCD69EA
MKFTALFVFIFALIAIVLCTEAPPVLGAKKCTWGPAYWCDSKENAEECGAVEHCQSKVWNKST